MCVIVLSFSGSKSLSIVLEENDVCSLPKVERRHVKQGEMGVIDKREMVYNTDENIEAFQIYRI